MKRFWLTVTIPLIFLSAAMSYAQQTEREPRSDLTTRIIPVPKRYNMPSFTPRPDIDYKIQRMAVDESIDYKILNAAPRKVTADELKQRTRPPLFKFSEIIEKISNFPSESVFIKAESHRSNLIIKVLGTLK